MCVACPGAGGPQLHPVRRLPGVPGHVPPGGGRRPGEATAVDMPFAFGYLGSGFLWVTASLHNPQGPGGGCGAIMLTLTRR